MVPIEYEYTLEDKAQNMSVLVLIVSKKKYRITCF